MVGALSISASVDKRFVSKHSFLGSEHIAAKSIVVSLNLASVGTFLSIALKVPYLTWFAPDRSIETQPIPWNMYAGMILAGAINLANDIYQTC